MPWDTGDEARGCFSQVWREGTKEFHRQKEQCVNIPGLADSSKAEGERVTRKAR